MLVYIQWNLDLTKCQGTGEIGLLYRGFVILHTSILQISRKLPSVPYIKVQLVINLQNPAFLDLKYYRNNISVPSYT